MTCFLVESQSHRSKQQGEDDEFGGKKLSLRHGAWKKKSKNSEEGELEPLPTVKKKLIMLSFESFFNLWTKVWLVEIG